MLKFTDPEGTPLYINPLQVIGVGIARGAKPGETVQIILGFCTVFTSGHAFIVKGAVDETAEAFRKVITMGTGVFSLHSRTGENKGN